MGYASISGEHRENKMDHKDHMGYQPTEPIKKYVWNQDSRWKFWEKLILILIVLGFLVGVGVIGWFLLNSTPVIH